MSAVERLAAALRPWPVPPSATREGLAFHTLRADPALVSAIELGLAWQEAEAALPEGWWGPEIGTDFRHDVREYRATAGVVYREQSSGLRVGVGDTPAAALRHLVEDLAR